MDIANVLTRRFPGKEWGMKDNDYKTLDWQDESPKPTLKELQKLWPEVEAEIAKEIAEKDRLRDYERFADPIFFKYQRGEATHEEWLKAIDDVKKKYPYPEDVK